MPESLSFGLNFVHPLLEWSLLGLGGWVLYLGIKAKKVRTGTPEQRKALVSGKFAQRHYLWASLFLAVMVIGNLGGMAVTYINNGKLFVDAHLLAADATGQPDCPEGACRPGYGHAHPVPVAGFQWNEHPQQDSRERQRLSQT